MSSSAVLVKVLSCQEPQSQLTDHAVEETNGNDRGNCPEHVPEQEVRVIEDAERRNQFRFPRQYRDHALCCAPLAVDLEPE